MLKNSLLIKGNDVFKESYFKKHQEEMLDLVENGQHPKTLFIGCSDSRVVPNLITQTAPGDLFVTRNIGNIVPPYNPEAEFHATAPAIEYSIAALKIEEIIVCGHTHCGAMAALHDLEQIDDPELVHTKQWLTQGLDTRAKALAQCNDKEDKQAILRLTEKLSVVAQLENLMTYPSVKKRVESGAITLRGWLYDMETGSIECYDANESTFKELSL